MIYIESNSSKGRKLSFDKKVLHMINNKPMLIHVIETAIKINPAKICIVVGKYYDIISKCVAQYFKNQVFSDFIMFINQPEPLGTGHALQCCKEYLVTIANQLQVKNLKIWCQLLK